MHPTAAVAGLPQLEAKQALRKLENFDRTWYAGTLGVMGPAYADFVSRYALLLLNRQKMTVNYVFLLGLGLLKALFHC